MTGSEGDLDTVRVKHLIKSKSAARDGTRIGTEGPGP